MLFGKTTKPSIYQTSYSSSLSDVSTLEYTTAKFQALFDQTDTAFIINKAFYNQKNLNLLSSKNIQFLVSVPFTNNFAKEQIVQERETIDNLKNLVLTNGDPIRGVHKCRVWEKQSVKLEVYVFFDPQRILNERMNYFCS
ncbi:MAG: hypothetical protein LBQ98_08300 [Nitrososphaerota archaeon]|jgi:transposase|nr:hypothetical protein [Nitrososphaerota archaeon]